MLSIEKLQAGYGGKAVVSIPSFELPGGKHCLISGQSGSGKTTLLYAIAGLLTPQAGNITLCGTALHTLNHKERDRFRGMHIGIVYQTLHMVGALTVLQNLLLAQYAAGVTQDETRALALLESLGLADYAHRKPDTLSQGQKQRVAIARAVMNAPSLIVADEPTSALDDNAAQAVMRLLLDAAKNSNASLLVATHDARINGFFDKRITLGVGA